MLRDKGIAAAEGARITSSRWPNPDLLVSGENFPWGSWEDFDASTDLDVFVVGTQTIETADRRGHRTRAAESFVELALTKQPDVLSLSPDVLEQGGIESVAVTTRELHETFEVTGRIQLDEDRTARVGSPAEGRVASIRVRLGDHVRRGDPLLDIHSHELIVARADYDKAKADLAAAERRLR